MPTVSDSENSTPKVKPGLKFLFHETILWASASLFLALTGSVFLIVINVGRLLANIILAYHQNQSGGARHSKVTPYFSQLAVEAANALFSVLEIIGVVTGTAQPAEVLYRAKTYGLNACFYLSAALTDTKFRHIIGDAPLLARILLNPNIWMGPLTFLSFSFAFAPLIENWGVIPHTQIPAITLIIGTLSLSISAQAIWQSYRLSTGFVARNYGLIVPTLVYTIGTPFVLLNTSASWQFGMYIALCAIGNATYLWRNRKVPQYLLERKPQTQKGTTLVGAH